MNESFESETTSSTVLEEEFIDKETFSQAVVYHMQFYKTTLVEAIIDVSERVGLDPEYDSDRIRDLIDQSLVQRLTVECIQNKTIRIEATSALDC